MTNPHFAIDIGSNTILLLIKHPQDKTHREENYIEFAKLAENINLTHQVSNEAQARAVKILTHYRSIIEKVDRKNPTTISLAKRIKAIATSAIRDANNQKAVIHTLEKALGHPIEVISPETEASLTYHGTVTDFKSTDQPTVLDIGGGSTELITEIDHKIYSKSYKIGAVRFKDQFVHTTPITEASQRQITTAIDELIDNDPPFFLQDQPTPQTLIGVAGIPTTLATIKYNGREVDYEKVHLKPLSLDDVTHFRKMFCKLTPAEVIESKIVNSKRAEIMSVSCLILQRIMKKFGFTSLQVSTKGLRYGVMNQLENPTLK